MPPRPGPPRLVAGPDTALVGSDYTDEERAFLMAVEGYKRRHGAEWQQVREEIRDLRADVRELKQALMKGDRP